MKRRLGIAVGTLALGLSLFVPAASGANTLYAVASGGVSSGSCSQASPCTFDFALSSLATGDTLMLFPGTYQIPTGAATCSNSSFGFDLKNATVEGIAGLPAPTLNEGPNCGTLQVDTGATLRHVIGTEDPNATSQGSPAFLVTGGGVLDAITDQNSTGVIGIGNGKVENSFIAGLIFFGAGGVAVNDTTRVVIVEGTQFMNVNTSGSANVINTIATTGFEAYSVNADGTGPPTATATMTLSHYSGTHSTTPPAGAGSNGKAGTITPDTPAGVGAPALASDHLHELAGSPTIDAGTTVMGGPINDFDGGIRNNGIAPDVGADEYGTAVPTLSTLAATNVTSTTATLNGTINTNQVDNPNVSFLYGPGVSLSSQTLAHDVPAGVTDVPQSASLTGLTPNTTYSFVLTSGAHQALVATFHTANAGPPPNPFKGISFQQSSAGVSSKRALSLKLYCPSDTIGFCKGTLALTGGKTQLGSTKFLSNHGNLFTVKLTLSKSGFALLVKKRSLSATATSVAHDANGNAKTTSASVKLKAPPKPKPKHKKKHKKKHK